VAWTAVTGLPAAAVLLATWRGRGLLVQVAGSGAVEWTPPLERLAELPRWIAPGPLWRALVVFALVLVALGLAVVRARRRSLDPRDAALAVAAAVSLALAAFAPLHIPGWDFFAPRFAPLAAMLAVATLDPSMLRSAGARALVLPAAAALALGSAATSAALHRDLASACAPALAALDAPVRRAGMLLPIVGEPRCGLPSDPAESPVPHLAPLLNVGALYAVAQGGAVPYLFMGTPSVHPIGPRDAWWRAYRGAPPAEVADLAATDRFRDDAAFRRGLLTRVAALGVHDDAVLLVGVPADDVQAFLRRGYLADVRTDALLLAHFRGCDARVELRSARDRVREAVVEYGLPPVAAPVARGTVALGAGSTLALPDRPCGPIWLRVLVDRDGSGAPSPGDEVCAEAGADGRVLATVDEASPTVSCTLAPIGG
jgi:hypothetical protein